MPSSLTHLTRSPDARTTASASLSSLVRTSSNATPSTLAELYRVAPDPAARGQPLLPRLDDARAGARRRVSIPVGGRHEGRAGGRVGRLAARQPSRRPGSGPRDPPGPSAQVLPRAAQARRRPVRRLSARLCVRARADHAHGRPARSPDARRLRRRVPARRAADHRRDLGDPDHAAAGAGRRAAPARGRRRRGAPQPRSRARVGRPVQRPAAREPERIIDEMLRDEAGSERPALGGVRRRAAPLAARSAVVRRARRGMRCSARSKRRTTRPKRCCASSTSARPPASSPSATSSRPCGCCRRSTGRSSSSASAWSSRSFARIPRARTRAWISRRATATATRSSSWRARAKVPRAGRRPARGRHWRRPRRRTSPDRDRTHHVGYYLISRGRFRLEQEVGYPPTLRDRFARFFYGHPVLGYLGTIAGVTALGVASFVAYAHRHGGARLSSG